MVPSSFMISTITPAGEKPPNLAKSIAASVWPVRLSTPPSLATKGNICPGLDRSLGLVFLSVSALIVLALSAAEIPVVTPCPFKSTETVKAVSSGSVLFCTIRCRDRDSHRRSVRGAHISPLPCVAMKLIMSGVTASAAAKKSPSFSLFSSSTTIIIFPAFISAMALSIVSKALFSFILLSFSNEYIFEEIYYTSELDHPFVFCGSFSQEYP